MYIEKIEHMFYNLKKRTFSEKLINWCVVHRRWNYMKETKEYEVMTNEEYRKEIRNIFDGIQENYKLRWFYIFISEKIKG